LGTLVVGLGSPTPKKRMTGKIKESRGKTHLGGTERVRKEGVGQLRDFFRLEGAYDQRKKKLEGKGHCGKKEKGKAREGTGMTVGV